jgi:anti-anti-sigma factor
MKVIHRGDTLNITEVSELSARTCDRFRSELEPLLPSSRSIRIDLSETDFIDCRGVSTLLALQRLGCATSSLRSLTVLNPNRCVRRIIGLTGLSPVVAPEANLPGQLNSSETALSAISAALNPGQIPLTVTLAIPAASAPGGASAAPPARLSVPQVEIPIPLPASPALPPADL